MRETLLVLGLVTQLLGCSGLGVKPEPARLYWPPAPEIPRLVHEATLRSVLDIAAKPSALDQFKSMAVGGAPDEKVGMDKPYDVAARHGLLAVTDTRAAVVYVYDLVRGHVFPIGWRGEGKLVRPSGVAIDEQDQIYVADSGRNLVVVFDGYGLFLRSIGKPSDFDRLVDVAVSPDGQRIYALDRGDLASSSHQVREYSASGDLVKTFGGRGTGSGEFNNPTQIVAATSGELYVLDAGNFRVQVFSAEGEFQRMWGRAGQSLGDLARPRGLAVDAHENVYVTDAAFQNVQIFNRAGQLLLTLGEAGPDQPGHFALLGGVAEDALGNIYIVDQLYRKVEVWRLLD